MQRKNVISVVASCFVVLALGLWSFWPGIEPVATFDIAEGAFRDYVRQRGWSLDEFTSPSLEDVGSGDSVVRLDWKSKSQPGCMVQVDVDRKAANARPSWHCS